jgi:hypothetical protein
MDERQPFELTGETTPAKLKEITDKLESGISELFDSERYAEYLRVMSKFHGYSFSNAMLIFMQKPDASLIAGFNKWRDDFKRFPRKGEKGIKIFAPAPYKTQQEVRRLDPDGNPVFDGDGNPVTDIKEVKVPAFKVVSVFDVSQTYGEPIPDISVDELTGSVEQYGSFFAALKQASPVPTGFEKISSGAQGYYSHAKKRIALQEGMSELQTLKTYIHEIAHAKLHDIDLNAPRNEQNRADKRTREVQAESVAYTVCQHYGLDTSEYSFGYIAGWSGGKEMKELKASLETIRNAAAGMITDIDRHFAEWQKKLTVTTGLDGQKIIRESDGYLRYGNGDLQSYVLPDDTVLADGRERRAAEVFGADDFYRSEERPAQRNIDPDLMSAQAMPPLREQLAHAYAADYYRYMTARNVAQGLPPFGLNEPDNVIADLTADIMDGGFDELRNTLRHSIETYGESWLADTDITVTAAILLDRLEILAGAEQGRTLNDAMRELEQEVKETLQFFIGEDINNHGELQPLTLEMIAKQGFVYRDGELEISPEADTPERLAQDYHAFMERIDFFDYKSYLGISGDEQPLQSIARFIENGGADLLSLHHSLDDFINEYTDDPDLKEEVYDAEKLYARFTAYDDREKSKENELLNGKGDRYGIYQLTDTRKYGFMPLEAALRSDMHRNHYRLMYTAPLPPGSTPERLYAFHNMDNRPDGDKMRSMSMSDVLVMKQGKNISTLYADTYGFRPIQGFLERDSYIRAAEMSAEQNLNMIDGIPNNTAPNKVEIRAAVVSNYTGVGDCEMDAFVAADEKVYLGKRENYHHISPFVMPWHKPDQEYGDTPSYYDNSDHSLVFITGNQDIYPFLYGEGWLKLQKEMMADGFHTPETYGEWAELKAGVLAQFTEVREILFNGEPFKAPNRAPSMQEIEADVAAGKAVSLMDIVNAQKNERKADPPGKKPSMLGQLEKNKAAVAQNKEAAAEKPPRKPGLEVDD